MAKFKSGIVLHATADEGGQALLLQAFQLVSPSLGHYLKCSLSGIYGDESWRRRAGRFLTQQMTKRLEMTGQRPLKDIYLICELILNNLEELSAGWVDIDGVIQEGFRLERLAVDVDNVSRTRTVLFHGRSPTVREVYRALVSLVRLLHRIPAMCEAKLDDLCNILKVTHQLQMEAGEAQSSCSPLTFNTADLSNILLLRLIKIAECEELAQEPEQVIKQDLSSANSRSFQGFHPSTIVKKENPEWYCSPTGQAHVVSSLTMKKPSKTLAKAIKYERNLFAHGARLSLGETLACFNKVKTLLKSREKSRKNQGQRTHHDVISGIEILECARRRPRCALVEVYLTGFGTKVQSRMLLTPPKMLVGREDVLQQLQTLVTGSENNPKNHGNGARVLLHGFAGVGKTAVVRELAKRLEKTHPDQFVFQSWTQRTLDTDINCFLNTESSAQLKDSSSSPVKNLKTFLKKTQRTYLLVFENVNSIDPTVILHLLPKDKHCTIFTSASEHLWRKHGLVPEQVQAVAVHGLTLRDSYHLLRDIFDSVGSLHGLRELTDLPEKRRNLSGFLRNTFGSPLAIRLAAYQNLATKAAAPNSVAVGMTLEVESALELRSEADKIAAGRVHARGFYHVMRHALTSLSNDTQSIILGYIVALTTWRAVPVWFVEEVLIQLGFNRFELPAKINVLATLGLIEKDAEYLLMQPLLQNYLMASISCLYPKITKTAVTAVIAVIYKSTLCYQKKKLFEVAVENVEPNFVVEGCNEKSYLHRLFVEMHLERVTTRLLSHAGKLDLSIKDISLCLACLRWCQQRRCRKQSKEVCPVLKPEMLQNKMAGETMDISMSDTDCTSIQETEKWFESLKAYWSYFPHEDQLRKILLDVDYYTSAPLLLEKNRLVQCGAAALLSKGNFRQALHLFDICGCNAENLVESFVYNGNETFASSALLCAIALINSGEFMRAKRILFQIVQIWRLRRKNCTLGLHEDILKAALELCESHRMSGRRREALELCNIAYFIGEVDTFSKSAPALLLNVCYQACKLLAEESMDCCSRDELWLHRLDRIVESMPDIADKMDLILYRVWGRLLARPLLNPKVSATVAGIVLKRLLSLRLKTRARVLGEIDLNEIIVPLLFVAGSLGKASDLDNNFLRLLCRKIANIAREREVHLENVLSKIEMLRSFCSIDTANRVAILYSGASTFFQKLVKPNKALTEDPFIKKDVWSRFSAAQPDPLATIEVLQILSEELSKCGKGDLVHGLREALTFWPQSQGAD